MAGMDRLTLQVIEHLAKNEIQDAKKAALACCVNDTTKKNEVSISYYKRLLENGDINLFKLPSQLQGMLKMESMENFKENRYFLGFDQDDLFRKIELGTRIYDQMTAYGVPYFNTTLIYGEPGTGKTEFAKYVAYKLNLPFAYVNFSNVIDAYLGHTALNIQKIFDFCAGQKCVLVLDEIDCIGFSRGGRGVDGEMSRTTITLMQCLDHLVDGQIIIATTNRKDMLDKALLRRFRNIKKFNKFSRGLSQDMAYQWLNDFPESFKESIKGELDPFLDTNPSQAEIFQYLTDRLAIYFGSNLMEQ